MAHVMQSTAQTQQSVSKQAQTSQHQSVGFLCRNGKLVERHMSRTDFLSQYPRGAYTTTRTLNRNSIFRYSQHIERLAESVNLMLQDDFKNKDVAVNLDDMKRKLADVLHVDRLKRVVTDYLCSAYKDVFSDRANEKKELDVCILVTWHTPFEKQVENVDKPNVYDVYTHFSYLQDLPQSPVKIKLERAAHRDNAKADDSSWVNERQALEAAKTSDIHEVVIVENGQVLEGLTSNFFAVKQNKVYSAVDRVLTGTVQTLVFDVCQQNGIDVEKKAPLIDECRNWDGCFITSACRFVLPIDQLILPGEQKHSVQFNYDQQSLVYRIQQLVMSAANRSSEKVFE